jgi:methyl-accepting chemotaxis protein
VARTRYNTKRAILPAAVAAFAALAFTSTARAAESGDAEDIWSTQGAVELPTAGAVAGESVRKSETPKQAPTGEAGRRPESQRGPAAQPAPSLPLREAHAKAKEQPANRSADRERDEYRAAELRRQAREREADKRRRERDAQRRKLKAEKQRRDAEAARSTVSSARRFSKGPGRITTSLAVSSRRAGASKNSGGSPVRTALMVLAAIAAIGAVMYFLLFAGRDSREGGRRMKWTIGSKILSGYMVVILFVGITGGVGYWGITTVARNLVIVGDEVAPIVECANEMKLSLMTARNAMEEYKGATAAMASDDESSLAEITASYQRALDDFDVLAEAIMEGGSLADGTVVIRTSDRKLADLVQQSDRIHNDKFQAAASLMMRKGLDLIKAKKESGLAMEGMEALYDEVIADAGKVEGMISREIRERAKTGQIGAEAQAILLEEVPLADMANEIKIALAETRIALEEIVQMTDASEVADVEKRYREKIAQFDDCVEAILSGGNVGGVKVIATDNDAVRDAVRELDGDHTDFQKQADVLIARQLAMIKEMQNAEAAMNALDASGDDAAVLLTKVEETAGQGMTDAKDAGATAVTVSSTYVVVTLTIAVIFGVVIGVVLTRGITRPISAIVKVAQAIATGDLTQKVDVRTSDETGDLARTFNDMTDNLSNVVGQILNTSGQVRTASDDVSTTAQQSASGAQQQQQGVEQISSQAAEVSSQMEEVSSQIEEMASGVEQASATVDSQLEFVQRVSATMEEMGASVAAVSDNASKARDQGSGAVGEAQKGQEAVRDAMQGMDEISGTIGELATVIGSLGQRSNQIGEIVDTITGIASQTNLLALNAAIEAARAGEHGRGFAVVADEVRKLAERTAQATEEIETLVKGIQDESQNAVRSTELGIEKVSHGGELTKNVGNVLETIVGSIQDTSEAIQGILASAEEQSRAAKDVSGAVEELTGMSKQIAKGMSEQSKGAQQISQAVAQTAKAMEETSASVQEVSGVTNQVAAGAQEMASSAEELSAQADGLQDLMTQFTISNGGSGQQSRESATQSRKTRVGPGKRAGGSGGSGGSGGTGVWHAKRETTAASKDA